MAHRTDHLSPQERSENMRRVRGKDTLPELAVRRALHKAGFRFRLHRKDLPGRPDIFLPRHKLVVFVHGCFWHGHEGCKRATIPATRTEFWSAKIEANRRRDAAAEGALRSKGLRVVTLWQCQLSDDEEILRRIWAADMNRTSANG